MPLDQKVHLLLLFRLECKPRCRTFDCFYAADHVVFIRHSFSYVVQQQSQNEKIAAPDRLPEFGELNTACIRGSRQLLQVLNSAQ